MSSSRRCSPHPASSRARSLSCALITLRRLRAQVGAYKPGSIRRARDPDRACSVKNAGEGWGQPDATQRTTCVPEQPCGAGGAWWAGGIVKPGCAQAAPAPSAPVAVAAVFVPVAELSTYNVASEVLGTRGRTLRRRPSLRRSSSRCATRMRAILNAAFLCDSTPFAPAA